jgi:hypothetical protein
MEELAKSSLSAKARALKKGAEKDQAEVFDMQVARTKFMILLCVCDEHVLVYS